MLELTVLLESVDICRYMSEEEALETRDHRGKQVRKEREMQADQDREEEIGKAQDLARKRGRNPINSKKKTQQDARTSRRRIKRLRDTHREK
ncbi:MAG TPA: hypothetical protein VEZ90_12840 [Blastocatellia bacterium]|nr:hypothetical protein [Blastocatellia bacterium]